MERVILKSGHSFLLAKYRKSQLTLGMQIFLIGFMGSGKSFTAKALSELLDRPYLDLDDYIEKRGGQSIAQIFKFGGEQHFRKIEHDSLKAIIKEYPNHIIATGGGAPVFHNNLELMKACGLTVYLDATIDILAKRLENELLNRPLLQNATGEKLKVLIKTLLEPRLSYYQQCHIAVEIMKEDLPVAKIIAKYFENIS